MPLANQLTGKETADPDSNLKQMLLPVIAAIKLHFKGFQSAIDTNQCDQLFKWCYFYTGVHKDLWVVCLYRVYQVGHSPPPLSNI